MNLAFYVIALLTLASALAAMSLRRLVHCALALVATFAGIAAMFLHLNAPFIAFAQVLVYVGAVAILIVFAILLTRNSEAQEKRTSGGFLLCLAISGLVAGMLFYGIGSFANPPRRDIEPAVHALGTKLMTTHVVPLEIVALLLTAATIGAVVLALQDKSAQECGAGIAKAIPVPQPAPVPIEPAPAPAVEEVAA